MTRILLKERRVNLTKRITFTNSHGNGTVILITIGYDEHGKAKEVFCADFKAGSDMHGIVSDACILFSRLLQHGEDAAELSRGMCQPHSLLGQIASAVVADEDFNS